MTRKTTQFPFEGGLDLVAAPLSMNPGGLIGVSNYEVFNDGYSRIDGYERYDGNQRPSESPYWFINFTSGEDEILTGDVLGELSGSPTINAVAVADAVVTSGSWAGNDAAGYVAVAYDSRTALLNPGNLADTNTLYEGATLKAVVSGSVLEYAAPTDALNTTYTQLAIEYNRSIISTVPGSGNIRGVWVYAGDVYVFRDNAGATACVMHKATPTGWAAQSLGYEHDFTSGGTYEIAVGDTITGATSGATAVITGVVVQSGSWATSDAVGQLYFASVTSGPFQAENLNVGANSDVATIAGAEVANTLTAGGNYEFINYNFYGSADTKKMYGCNGLDRAFQWDGTNFFAIHTGMVTDTPTHITAHRKHLFLSFESSAQHSSIGNPLQWNAITGASEIATGDNIVGFAIVPGDALAIINRNSTYILYGSSTVSWNLVQLSDESGAIEWSIQRIGRPMYLDDRGLTTLEAVDAYGDFSNAVFSSQIRPLLDAKKALVTTSVRVRDKNQYRLFFSDNSFVIASFENNKFSGFTECNYDVPVLCACSSEDSTGDEVLYFGSTDGYVYQMDKGTSFDGSAVTAFLRLAFNNIKSAEYIKRYFKATIECTSADNFTSQITYDFDYSERQGITHDILSNEAGDYWNIGNWNEFNWGGAAVSNQDIYISGSGRNVGMSIVTELTYEQPHTFHGSTLHYSVRGLAR
jgi:hypothetical protein